MKKHITVKSGESLCGRGSERITLQSLFKGEGAERGSVCKSCINQVKKVLAALD